ncbi:MAG: V-type ATP synthase subunit F [Spirochaetaceae bacterium]|jgi:V/A-type H+-transporting ATPase subunit F|nr:V-type ATP synthase subunit F [Spirochaetaceae bacterium]
MDYYFIGEDELLTAFRFAGVDGCAVSNADEALQAFTAMTVRRKDAAAPSADAASRRKEPPTCKILILSEQAAVWLRDELIQWQLSGEYPLVVEVPPLTGNVEGRKTLVESIREAIGIHV